MPNLLQKYARCERHDEHNKNHPDACTVYGLALSHHLAHVNAYKEDGHTAPEYLQMSHSVMDWRHPLHQNTPHNHDDRKPAINRMAPDQLHIRRCKKVKHHGSGNIPERKFVVKPEVPVDGDVASEVNPRHEATAMEARNIIQTGYDNPRRVYAEITTAEEPAPVGMLHP